MTNMIWTANNLVVRNARLRGQDQLVDIGIDNGKITAVGPKLAGKGQQELDAAGSLLLPGLLNLHLHCGQVLLGEVMRPNVSGTLPEAIEITNDFKRHYDPAEVARARRPRRRSRRHRRHDLLPAVRRRRDHRRPARRAADCCGARAVSRAGRRPGGRVSAGGHPARSRRRRLLRGGDGDGCDVVGGLPWYEYTDEEARQHVDVCFAIAREYDLDMHMLVDDTDDPNSRSLEYLALKTMREGFHGRVAASHCGAMAAYNDVYAAKVIDMVARRRHHHLVQRPHQPGLLGAAGPRAARAVASRA